MPLILFLIFFSEVGKHLLFEVIRLFFTSRKGNPNARVNLAETLKIARSLQQISYVELPDNLGQLYVLGNHLRLRQQGCGPGVW